MKLALLEYCKLIPDGKSFAQVAASILGFLDKTLGDRSGVKKSGSTKAHLWGCKLV